MKRKKKNILLEVSMLLYTVLYFDRTIERNGRYHYQFNVHNKVLMPLESTEFRVRYIDDVKVLAVHFVYDIQSILLQILTNTD